MQPQLLNTNKTIRARYTEQSEKGFFSNNIKNHFSLFVHPFIYASHKHLLNSFQELGSKQVTSAQMKDNSCLQGVFNPIISFTFFPLQQSCQFLSSGTISSLDSPLSRASKTQLVIFCLKFSQTHLVSMVQFPQL